MYFHLQLLQNIDYIPFEPYICASHSPLHFAHPPSGNQQFVLGVCIFFVTLTSLLHFLDFTHKWYHTVFVFLWWLTLLSLMPCKSIHVTANGNISIFLQLSSIPLYVYMCIHIHTYILICIHIYIYIYIYMYIYIPHSLYLFICWWAFQLLPCLGL